MTGKVDQPIVLLSRSVGRGQSVTGQLGGRERKVQV